MTIENEKVCVSPVGELDLATVPTLDARFRQVSGAHRELAVDLSGLTFIDSSGLHLLLKWCQWAADAGIAFSILPGRPAVQRVFWLAGVEHLLPFALSGAEREGANSEEL